jgi:hypothetical protein
MPDLDFAVTGVEPVRNGLTPMLRFKVRIRNLTLNPQPLEEIQALILQAQIQIQAPHRQYSASEQAKLLDIFGTPDRWGHTMQNRFWTNASVTTGAFVESVDALLLVPCTCDLDVLATKYFNGLDGGEVPLLFLFSGSVFYRNREGQLQVHRISWEKDCVYKMPVTVWQDLMEFHYPNSAWLSLRRDVYERLCAFRREGGLASWEEAIERLLPDHEAMEVKV